MIIFAIRVNYFKNMYSPQYFSELINRWVSEIEYPARPEGLYEPIAYMLSGGGKRLRPTLMCIVAAGLGVAPERVRNQALGIEMFHNFTLLHDDVMDNADVRHGRPTVHCRWDVPTAILSGDTMLTLSSRLMADIDEPCRSRIMPLFDRTAIEVYEGQQYDMNFERAETVSIGEYLEMIRLKTAVLLGCACRVGAVIGDATEAQQEKLYGYGINMGMAFQLRDDYLDTFGDPATFGKAIGGDILNDKKTWLSIAAQKVAPAEMNAAKSIADPVSKVREVKAIYCRYGIDAECTALIKEYTQAAVNELNDVNISDQSKQLLNQIALSAINRNS